MIQLIQKWIKKRGTDSCVAPDITWPWNHLAAGFRHWQAWKNGYAQRWFWSWARQAIFGDKMWWGETPLIAIERDEFGFLQKINPQTPCHQFPASCVTDGFFRVFSDMFHARLPVISASWPMEMHGIRGFPWQTMQAEMMKTTLRWIQDSMKLLFQLGASNFATILWVLMLILVDIYSWALCFHRSM